MKNFTSLLIASSLLISGTAMGRELKHNVIPQNELRTLKIDKQVQPEKSRLHHDLTTGKRMPQKSSPAKVGEYGKIITSAPEGNVEILNRSGSGYLPYWYSVAYTEYDGRINELVTCDNGDVYLKNPVSMLISDSYLKGYKDGNQLIFELPQALSLVDYYDDYQYELVATLLQYSDADDWYVPVNTDAASAAGLPEVENILVINIEADGSYSYEASDAIFGVMYGDDIEWAGYADLDSKWSEFDGDAVEAPNDLTTTQVAVRHDGIGNFAQLGFDGNDVYIQGLFEEMPDAWVKGTLDSDKISFASGQYLGMDLAYCYFTYFMAAKLVTVYDEEYDYYYYDFEPLDEVTFSYDAETMTLTSSEDDVVVLSVSANEVTSLNYYISPVIARQNDNISQTPANPYNLDYYDYMEYYGYSYFYFALPLYNESGELLNSSDLYYRIFVDGDEYEFDTTDYYYLSENMTLVPYNFTDNYDFEVAGTEHGVYLYFEGAEELGVQLCNIHDGELLGQSEIVILNTDPSGVKEIGKVDSKPIESVKYFNVNGQQVSGNEAGFLIKTTIYGDGSQKSVKIMKR